MMPQPQVTEAPTTQTFGQQEPRVLALNLPGGRVLCSAMHAGWQAAASVREDAKLRLAHALWKRRWAEPNDHERSPQENPPVVLRRNGLGKPRLLVGGQEDHSISFTHLPGLTWAALCRDSKVGIDAAESVEFEGRYPFHRAFHEDEIFHAMAAGSGRIQEAAALIWSAREAAVKAVGAGFHRIDPKEVRTRIAPLNGERPSMSLDLECNVPETNSLKSLVTKVRAYRCEKGWISIALAGRSLLSNKLSPCT